MNIPEDRIESTFGDILKGIVEASHRENTRTAENALGAAQILSSGTMSYAEQRKLDHPFAKRHGTPLTPAWLVNRHNGDFYLGWKMREGMWGEAEGYSTPPTVYNDSKVASFLEQKDGGTDKGMMFARPVDEKVIEKVLPLRERIFEEELQRTQP